VEPYAAKRVEVHRCRWQNRMNVELYNQFLSRKAFGDQEGAEHSVYEFCNSFASLEEKLLWTKEFLESGDYGHRIRHELYVRIILPALLDGYRKKDFWCTLWLARTCKNLYRTKDLHAELGHPTDFSLFRECYQIDPSHEEVRTSLLDRQLSWFRYYIHEWPAGVLYGNDGATRGQCEEILKELAFARELDTSHKFLELFDDVELKTREYMKTTANHGPNRTIDPRRVNVRLGATLASKR
jgi:hypothetical protein